MLVKERTTKANNNEIIRSIMEQWNCSYYEAHAACEFNCYTIQDTRFRIAQAVTYNRLVKQLFDGIANYLRNEHYKGKPEASDESFIRQRALEMSKEQAEDFVYIAGFADDFDEISESEIRECLT